MTQQEHDYYIRLRENRGQSIRLNLCLTLTFQQVFHYIAEVLDCCLKLVDSLTHSHVIPFHPGDELTLFGNLGSLLQEKTLLQT